MAYLLKFPSTVSLTDSQKSRFHAILISEIIWVAESPLTKIPGLSFLVPLIEVRIWNFLAKDSIGVCQPQAPMQHKS